MKDINKDIENLEEIINLINKELDKKDKNVSAILDLKDLLSLRNLIKAYKELEYKYNKALSDLVQAEHKNKELEEENTELKTMDCVNIFELAKKRAKDIELTRDYIGKREDYEL